MMTRLRRPWLLVPILAVFAAFYFKPMLAVVWPQALYQTTAIIVTVENGTPAWVDEWRRMLIHFAGQWRTRVQLVGVGAVEDRTVCVLPPLNRGDGTRVSTSEAKSTPGDGDYGPSSSVPLSLTFQAWTGDIYGRCLHHMRQLARENPNAQFVVSAQRYLPFMWTVIPLGWSQPSNSFQVAAHGGGYPPEHKDNEL